MIDPIKLKIEDQEKLIAQGSDIEALEREITKAERAGLDMKDLRAKFDKGKKLREGILREYGN